MYAIYSNIYHQSTPVMLAYIPAPWILWLIVKRSLFFRVFDRQSSWVMVIYIICLPLSFRVMCLFLHLTPSFYCLPFGKQSWQWNIYHLYHIYIYTLLSYIYMYIHVRTLRTCLIRAFMYQGFSSHRLHRGTWIFAAPVVKSSGRPNWTWPKLFRNSKRVRWFQGDVSCIYIYICNVRVLCIYIYTIIYIC